MGVCAPVSDAVDRSRVRGAHPHSRDGEGALRHGRREHDAPLPAGAWRDGFVLRRLRQHPCRVCHVCLCILDVGAPCLLLQRQPRSAAASAVASSTAPKALSRRRRKSATTRGVVAQTTPPAPSNTYAPRRELKPG
jgi:hypothetical protein